MSVFREIEKKLEAVFEGFFAQQFSSKLQPVEIAKKISALIEDERQIGPVHTYVPNEFNIFLSYADYQATEGLQEQLKKELKTYILTYVEQNGYLLPGPVKLNFAANESLATGQFLVTALFEEKKAAQSLEATQMLLPEEAAALTKTAYLENSKTKTVFALTEPTVSLGRNKNNSIVIKDPSVSRYHAKILKKDDSYTIFDLNSTNGTFVNQQLVREARLSNNDTITLGQTTFVFKVK